jgi:hypothetical protein
VSNTTMPDYNRYPTKHIKANKDGQLEELGGMTM